MRTQELTLTREGTGYKLTGDNSHKRRVYGLLEQAERLGELLKPMAPPTSRGKAWQKAFWSSDMRETIQPVQHLVMAEALRLAANGEVWIKQ